MCIRWNLLVDRYSWVNLSWGYACGWMLIFQQLGFAWNIWKDTVDMLMEEIQLTSYRLVAYPKILQGFSAIPGASLSLPSTSMKERIFRSPQLFIFLDFQGNSGELHVITRILRWGYLPGVHSLNAWPGDRDSVRRPVVHGCQHPEWTPRTNQTTKPTKPTNQTNKYT